MKKKQKKMWKTFCSIDLACISKLFSLFYFRIQIRRPILGSYLPNFERYIGQKYIKLATNNSAGIMRRVREMRRLCVSPPKPSWNAKLNETYFLHRWLPLCCLLCIWQGNISHLSAIFWDSLSFIRMLS